MSSDNLFERVSAVIEKDIKPFIEMDGGRIKLKRIEDGKVFVHLSGACAGCPAISLTLKGSIERILKKQFEEIIAVMLD